MLRESAYRLLWLLAVIYFLPQKVSAHRESRDSAVVKVEESEPGDYDYIIPAEAQSGTIPFTRAGNLIIIQAMVDSVSGNFILDTGAPGLILNLTYFRDYKGSDRADADAIGITGGASVGSPTMVKKLNFGAFAYTQVNADRVSLGHIENKRGIKILGLLGAGLFKRFEIMIDYANEVIHLHRVARNEKMTYRGYYATQKNDYHTIPIRIQDGKLIARLVVGGQKLNFVLDTGAESNVFDSRLKKGVMSHVMMDRKISLIGSGSKKVDAWYGRVTEAELGPVKLENMEVLITSMQYMSLAYDRNIDGMLGYPFLSKQKIGINFLTNELYLWK